MSYLCFVIDVNNQNGHQIDAICSSLRSCSTFEHFSNIFRTFFSFPSVGSEVPKHPPPLPPVASFLNFTLHAELEFSFKKCNKTLKYKQLKTTKAKANITLLDQYNCIRISRGCRLSWMLLGFFNVVSQKYILG
jgi:hypothetical protein